MTGTAAQVVAVTQVDHRPIGSGKMGPVTEKLRELFDQVVRNNLPAYQHWNVPVFE
jgi:branched-chain amino acid aminotransferase